MALSTTMVGDCVILDVIGGGASSTVYVAKRRFHEIVCLKLMNEEIPVDVQREIDNMKQCDHPNIIKLYDVIVENGRTALVMEYAANGTLAQYLTMNRMGDTMTRIVFRQLISAIEYLHKELRIMHRDIKAENVLLGRNNVVKLSDFGFSKFKGSEGDVKATACGSPAYTAPEVIRRDAYSFAADIWSCGIILYLMAVGSLPFMDANIMLVMRKIVEQDVEFPEDAFIDPDLEQLITRMLDRNPKTRITIDEIKENIWFNKQAELGILKAEVNGFGCGKAPKPFVPRLVRNLTIDMPTRKRISLSTAPTHQNLTVDMRRKVRSHSTAPIATFKTISTTKIDLKQHALVPSWVPSVHAK